MVYPEKIKPVRDPLVAHMKARDDPVYEKEDPLWDPKFICDTADMEWHEMDQTVLHRKIERSGLYGDERPPLLKPERFTIFTRNNKAYRVGHGAAGRVFLAQDKQTHEIVAIKGFVHTPPEKIIEECGYFLQAQQKLDDDNFEKAYLRGFLQIKRKSAMSKQMKPLMCVISLAGITKGAVMQLSLTMALVLAQEGKLGISKTEWRDIMYSVVLAAKQFYDQGLQHGDYHGKNIIIGYHNNRYKLTIIDFGQSCTLGRVSKKEDDLFSAMRLVVRAAKVLGWKITLDFANNILENREDLDWHNVLRDLEIAMNKDIAS